MDRRSRRNRHNRQILDIFDEDEEYCMRMMKNHDHKNDDHKNDDLEDDDFTNHRRDMRNRRRLECFDDDDIHKNDALNNEDDKNVDQRNDDLKNDELKNDDLKNDELQVAPASSSRLRSTRIVEYGAKGAVIGDYVLNANPPKPKDPDVIKYSTSDDRPFPPDQEVHEVESYEAQGGSLDEKDKENCGKENKHEGYHSLFVPVQEFTLERFKCQSLDTTLKKQYFDLIWAAIPLVVRITGFWVSRNRPRMLKDKETPFALSEWRGTDETFSGSGFVNSVIGPCIEGQPHPRWKWKMCFPCRCEDCVDGYGPGWDAPYWEIQVMTAKHVIFDDIEAAESEIVLFNDSPNGDSIRLRWGRWTRESVETYADLSKINYFTHDASLAARLKEHNRLAHDKADQLKEMRDSIDVLLNLPVVHIGHPHGKHKYVSWSDDLWWSSGDSMDDDTVKSTYSSCAGSSGGLVLVLDKYHWLFANHSRDTGHKKEGRPIGKTASRYL